MNVKSWLKRAKTRINPLDAELILLQVLKEKDRSFLVANDERELTEEEAKKAEEFILRREKGEPLAYILGFREFYGRKFVVSPDTLIPRPESEEIVEIVKKIGPKKILDVGTGSGCLAVSLKLEIPEAEVLASDISEKALEIAKKNAEKFRAEVHFVQSDLMEKIDGEFDTIVANLPYVDRNWEWISESLKFEPETALFAEKEGLELIFKLLEQAKKRCKNLVLEADTCQHEKIIAKAEENGYRFVEKSGFILWFA